MTSRERAALLQRLIRAAEIEAGARLGANPGRVVAAMNVMARRGQFASIPGFAEAFASDPAGLFREAVNTSGKSEQGGRINVETAIQSSSRSGSLFLFRPKRFAETDEELELRLRDAGGAGAPSGTSRGQAGFTTSPSKNQVVMSAAESAPGQVKNEAPVPMIPSQSQEAQGNSGNNEAPDQQNITGTPAQTGSATEPAPSSQPETVPATQAQADLEPNGNGLSRPSKTPGKVMFAVLLHVIFRAVRS